MTASMPAATKIGGVRNTSARPCRNSVVRALRVLVSLTGRSASGEQQHHKQGEHAERADEKISHRIAGGEIKHEAADKRPRSCTDVVCGREPTEPSAPSGLAETRDVSRGDGREDCGREAMYETQREQRPWIVDERIEERRHSEKNRPEHHHALAPQHVRKRAGR